MKKARHHLLISRPPFDSFLLWTRELSLENPSKPRYVAELGGDLGIVCLWSLQSGGWRVAKPTSLRKTEQAPWEEGFHWLSLLPLFASEISRVLTFIMHILSSGQLEILSRPFITPFAPAIASFDFPGWGRQPPFNYRCRTRSKCMSLSDQLHQKTHVLPSMKATSPVDEWDITQSVNSTKYFKTRVHAHVDVALLINTNNL